MKVPAPRLCHLLNGLLLRSVPDGHLIRAWGSFSLSSLNQIVGLFCDRGEAEGGTCSRLCS